MSHGEELSQAEAAAAIASLTGITEHRRGQALELVALFGDEGKVAYDTVVERLLPPLKPGAAETELYRRMGAVNDAAEEMGLSIRMVLTRKTPTKPVRWLRVVRLESPVEAKPGRRGGGRPELTGSPVATVTSEASAPGGLPARSMVPPPRLKADAEDSSPIIGQTSLDYMPSLREGFDGTSSREGIEMPPMALTINPAAGVGQGEWEEACSCPAATQPPKPARPDLERVDTELENQATPVEQDSYGEPRPTRQATGQRDAAGDLEDRLIVPELLAWAEDDQRSSLFILLGEYGMGKTVTCQSFENELRRRRESGHEGRWGLYFDLRLARGLVATGAGAGSQAATHLPTVEEVMLECARWGWDPSVTVTAEQLWQWIDEGAVVIFDGLDEVLSQLDDEDLVREFTSRLLSVVRRPGLQSARPAKMLVSTRIQFFRTLREQREMLTGHAFASLRPNQMEARLLLGLRDEQIEHYLSESLPGQDIAAIWQMLTEVYDLKDLSKRPVTLPFLVQAVPQIQRWRAEGQKVYGVMLYREFTRQWLGREVGKSQVKRPDKLRLAEDMAAELWRSGTGELHVDDLEDWFERWWAAQLDWERRYGRLSFDTLEEELRNTTFLRRRDDSADEGFFRFSHTSLQEFFLSEYLLRALRDDAPARWVMRDPSTETWDFFGQSLAEAGDQALVDRMGRWYSGEWAGTAGLSDSTIQMVRVVNDVILSYRDSAWWGKNWPQARSLDCPEPVDELRQYDRGGVAAVLELVRRGELRAVVGDVGEDPGDRVVLAERVWWFLGVLDETGRLAPAMSGPKKGELSGHSGDRGVDLDVRTVGDTRRAAVFLADRPIDHRAYHEDRAGASWADSSLRHWLAEDWTPRLAGALGADCLAEIEQDNRPKKQYQYKEKKQPKTRDAVFLLSNAEVVRLFKKTESRIMYRYDGKPWWWWLRSPGDFPDFSAYVYTDGHANDDDFWYGSAVASASGAVRPALALKLDS
ncbi:MAG: DUF6273 domain-containing protein [Propionibacteriaceae bacterium]|jgi:hypothetical protein|nr:DUF6273 domain-containing protein [Propionibacteriaceae bacterium]